MSNNRWSGSDVASLERAVAAAVAPPEVCEFDGWIAAFDNGTVSRAKSAAPLSHDHVRPVTALIRREYISRGLAPLFRLPRLGVFAAVEDELVRSGMCPRQPTDVQVAASHSVALAGDSAGVRIDSRPDDAWVSVFLGEGFDPVDGASRARTLARASGSLFASIRDGEQAIAAGVVAFGHGWASIHGMRTAFTRRGQRLATRILAALAQAAVARAHPRLMLQVESANGSAQKLYARCGFEHAWTYDYWQEA